jgi:transcriptional regulator with XRE-family HTH domain
VQRMKNPYKTFLYSKPIEQMAGLLKVKVRTLSKWRAGESLPTLKHMKTIVTASKGRVAYGDIVEYQLQTSKK